ncbi:MAG TPA: protein kinase [Kofleriaceae bacterium]|nr:protein kinase [Kofleriaceae bacterium]
MAGDGDSAKPRVPTHEDAFAATIAPASPTPPPPITRMAFDSGADATVAAPAVGALPPLPEVAAALYRTDHEIARGGMGKIVAAEDRRLGRPVALKQLIDPQPDHVTRFQREALITARLQHPGIVPVYEAGRWPTGEPFFAMKLVSGQPLDRVIADCAGPGDRLALLPRLAAACDAIAYAHSRRIIHRDLKPGNVLIGDFGETVVIDWGLAKDLDALDSPDSANRTPRAQLDSPTDSDSSTLTIAGAVMGTPAYMAPEQARGELVDQRADVFALGAMLYHLLAGAPPYVARTATEVLAAAASGGFTPLAKRERRVPRELAAIVDRAMAPIAGERYPHAGELADELRRFLTGQLVDAHRYTAAQRIARFVRRHRAAVTIATIAIATIAVGSTIAVRNIVRARDDARHEEDIANTRKLAAERLIDYTLTHLKTQLTAIGRLDLLAGLGSEVRRYYDKLARTPGGMPREDEIRMVEAIDLIGQAEHISGKPDQALATWQGARDEIQRIVGSDRGTHTFRLRRVLASIDSETGDILQERGQLDGAVAQLTKAKQEWDELHDEQPKERALLLGAADTHDKLGDLLRTEGKVEQAFDEYNEAKAERERAASQGNGMVTEEKIALSTSHLKLGSIYQNRGQSSLALDEYKRALELRQQILATQPDNAVVQEKVLDIEGTLADLERSAGQDDAAIDLYHNAIAASAQLAQRDPSNAEWQRQRADLLADLGFALIDTGDYAPAIAQLDQAIALQQELSRRDPKSTRHRVELSRSYTRAGDAQLALGDTDEALRSYKLALDLRRDLLGQDAASVPFRRSLAWSFVKLAGAYAQQHDLAAALDAHEQALAIRHKLVDEAPSQGGFKDELAASEVELGRLLVPRDARRSAQLIDDGVARARALVAGDPINGDWKQTLIKGLLARADAAAAAHDARTRTAALTEAQTIASAAGELAPRSALWPGFLGEIDVGLAEEATARGDRPAAAAAWKAARAALEPLAATRRLAVQRLPWLDRARARR